MMNSDEQLEKCAENAEAQNNFQEALQIWSQLARKTSDPGLYCRTGMAAAELDLWSTAEDAYMTALELDQTFSLAMECLGLLFFLRDDGSQDEDLVKSEQWFLKALNLERTARLLTLLSNTCAAMGETDNAREYLREAIKIDPQYEEAYFNLAELEKDQRPGEAVDLLCHAIEIDPNYAQAHQRLGVLLQRQGDLASAEYHFRRCLDLKPEDYWSYLYLANSLAVQNRIVEAEENYRIALKIQPGNNDVLRFFANFLDGLSRDQEAKQIRMRISGD
jgi:protein O-GlcNAc transferase